MVMTMLEDTYQMLLRYMAMLGFVVFVCLYFVNAGYGKFRSNKWGWSIGNKWGWMLMECPALLPMAYLWATASDTQLWPVVFALLYMTHYVYRTLIFPFLLKGKSRMPVCIIGMGMAFNLMNSLLLGSSIFLFPSQDYAHAAEYALRPATWIGIALFVGGAWLHIKSDSIIRHLRKPGDTRHYLPQGCMYRYVTSANYLGELVEWTGYALLLGNAAGWMFVWWTAANLVPRAHAIYKKYKQEFGKDALAGRKRIIPYIY